MSLFDDVKPRRDVLDGNLTEARFAASLEEVTGSAPDAYGDPSAFFASTYPSGGLKSLLNEAIGRVTGGRPDAASVIRLETNLGGGKTHNLIALYHAVRGGLRPDQAAELMDPALLPRTPIKQVGVFVGTSSGHQASWPSTAWRPRRSGATWHSSWAEKPDTKCARRRRGLDRAWFGRDWRPLAASHP